MSNLKTNYEDGDVFSADDINATNTAVNSIVVDQDYGPTSTNAQSGTAVAEALSNMLSIIFDNKQEVTTGSINDINEKGWYKISTTVSDRPVTQDGYLFVFPFSNNKIVKIYTTNATWNPLGNFLYCIYNLSNHTFDKTWNIPNDQLEHQNVMLYRYSDTTDPILPVINVDTVNHEITIYPCKIISNTKELTPSGASYAPKTTLSLTYTSSSSTTYGSIWYDFQNNTFVMRGILDKYRNDHEVLICRYYQYRNVAPTMCCNAPYTIDGCLFGINAKTSPIAFDDVVVLRPDYTYKSIALPDWSDFCFINDKMWFFKASSDETHQSANGLICICDKDTFAVEKTITHNLGHMNTCDYDSVTDRLVVGNLPNNATTNPPAAYIFYNVSDWQQETEIDWLTVDKTIIDLRIAGDTSINEASACWGQTNLLYRNELMISFQNGETVERILLGMGTNQFENGTYSATTSDKFNGTFKIIDYGKNVVHEKNLNSAIQGATYFKGKMLTCNGDGTSVSSSGDFTARSTFFGFDHNGNVRRQLCEFQIYNESGNIPNSNNYTEGIAIDENGEIHQGIITMQDGTVKKYIISYKV